MLHKKGWVTWIHKGFFDINSRLFKNNGDFHDYDNRSGGAILPEDNKYGINFPFSWFDVVE